MPNYYAVLGGATKLHQMVMVGTHDAAITQGHSNVQTQNLDIGAQADAGVRFFDLRVAAKEVTLPGDVKSIQLTAYHGDLVKEKRNVAVKGEQRQIKVSTMNYEGWGLSMTQIINGALAFFNNPVNGSEFLLFKFDKCDNWLSIAEACVDGLPNHLYMGGGHLNTKTLEDLKGKVVVMFPPKGIEAIRPAMEKARKALMGNVAGRNAAGLDGIVPWQSIQKDKVAYDHTKLNFQYCGGFGDSMGKATTGGKIQKNYDKQVENMTSATTKDPRVIRMMYWTTTGVLQDIEDRNREMWQPPMLKGFLSAWDKGLSNTIVNHTPNLPNALNPVAANQIRKFFPNIIMIDFADQDKCDLIFDLNLLTTGLVAKGQSLIAQRARSQG